MDGTKYIVNLAQTLLSHKKDTGIDITPSVIEATVNQVTDIYPEFGGQCDKDSAIKELIQRFSVWMGEASTLKNEIGHEAWLKSDRKRGWRYWPRYRNLLESQLPYSAVESQDKVTDSILGMLEDPMRHGSWDRRGLVVGHVQSGKTANYTGLICKAADAGYKIIVVLAGLHNNLRSQTQIRLEEGFLGYETRLRNDIKPIIGVGNIDSDPSIAPNCATYRADKGDFKSSIAKHLAISPEQRPWLFVVKKNKTTLTHLLKWIQNHVADTSYADIQINLNDSLPKVRKKVSHIPLLVIDDEADNASVDTGEQLYDSDGNPDYEHLPTIINRLIRRILFSFNRSAYVGYTATPFANIFIHDKAETQDDGKDLFPSSFIVNLAIPSNYIGPARVFGLLSNNGREGGLPLIREVSDYCSADKHSGWMPTGHKVGHQPSYDMQDTIPPSLVQAIHSFLLTCAVRSIRGQGNEHSSMLVHVSRYNAVQSVVHRQILTYVNRLRQQITRNINSNDLLHCLKLLWQQDFLPTTNHVCQTIPEYSNIHLPDWETIERELIDAVQDIEIKMITGTAKDALDYEEHRATGLKVIAVGGDKLARGLTLEGLSVSYFLRASKMYDTLMQMGRWFGYRPGYIDLCRLYTTSELIEWFGHIADASEELREEFDLMETRGETPLEYGLKVQSHPVLMVTSPLKMRTAKDLYISFSGNVLETVVFYKDQEKLRVNYNAAKQLISSIGEPHEINPKRKRASGIQTWNGVMWKNIPSCHVIDFLRYYQTHEESYKVKSFLIAEFIDKMNSDGELTNWTIALLGGEGDKCRYSDTISVNMLKRTSKNEYNDKYTIGRLLSPKDESIDLSEDEWNAALQITRDKWNRDPGRVREGDRHNMPDNPNGPSMRSVRGFGANQIAATREKGLLLLYGLDPKLTGNNIFTDSDSLPVIAFGISFPGSELRKMVHYSVNTVLWNQWENEYGATE